jgi:hypothetical protein
MRAAFCAGRHNRTFRGSSREAKGRQNIRESERDPEMVENSGLRGSVRPVFTGGVATTVAQMMPSSNRESVHGSAGPHPTRRELRRRAVV